VKTALDILLRSGEGQFTEFKSCYDQHPKTGKKARSLKIVAKDVAICLAELANTDGGTLLVGVENDGRVTGAPYNDDEIAALRTTAASSWKRPIPYSFEAHESPDGIVLVFEIDPQIDVFTLTDGRTPYRVKADTVWLPEGEVRALKRSKAGTLFERTIVSDASLNDLNPKLLDRFRESIGLPNDISNGEMLVQYDLGVRDGGEVRPTLAACLLFGKQPMTRFHERAGINFRKFEGTVALTGSRNNERMDKTIEGPLPVLLEETFRLLQTQIGVSRKLRDLFFEERPEYPTFAWQEAIVNAVAHRDYSLRGNETEVRMFDDRLEFKNPGLPPEPVTIEELQQRKPVHASRNPRIMRVLKALKFVRERGEGLPRMFEETEQSFLSPPELQTEGRFFKLTLRSTLIFDDETMSWLRTFPLKKLNSRQQRALAHAYQSGRGYFVLRDYAHINSIDKETAKREIRSLIADKIVEVVGKKKGAKYYPLLQRGSIEERLREYFSRHESLTNTEYRRLAGTIHVVTASGQLRKLVDDGVLRKEGKKRGTRYYPTERLLKTK
jgi:ATP-dependent DNA helicase RecG